MSAKESKKLSGDAVVGSSSRTVESLRGRLLTERQASRVANEEAELLENKLKELERKLKEETKLRGKAEKKLKFLMRKLHSLNITFTLDVNSSSSSSDTSGLFSSTASSSITTTTSFSSSSSIANNTEETESQFQEQIPETETRADSAPLLQHAKTPPAAAAADDDVDQSSSMALVPAVLVES